MQDLYAGDELSVHQNGGTASSVRWRRYRIAWLAASALVGIFYLWQVGSAFERFVWRDHLDGYYDLLARGFLNGHLYLPVQPRPELLALPNPWAVPDNRPYRLLDAALYDKKYYLYHGAVPAVVLFAPWRVLTRHDLPENIAALVFCFGGYLMLSMLLLEVLNRKRDPAPRWRFLLFCLTLGLANCVPFLLQLTLVYEVAIASGYFFLSSGFFFLFRTLISSDRVGRWAALCGLCFGLAIGCRPHLGLAILPSLALIALRNGRVRSFAELFANKSLLFFLIPVVFCGSAIAWYNYARFGNPLEFGVTYILGEPVYQNVHLALVNLIPGLYYMLACAPDFDFVFPFFRLARRPPFNSLHWPFPDRYFLEPTTGAFFLYPLLLLALMAPFFAKSFRDRSPVFAVITAMYVYSVACVLFIALTGLNSQRFEVDFLPFMVFISCAFIAAWMYKMRGVGRAVWLAAVSALLVYSIVFNLLYAVEGPFDQWLRNRPASYIKVARFFSPVEKYRPVLNPWLRAGASFEFVNNCAPGPYHPLIGLGKFGSRYMLSGACAGSGRLALYSDAFYNVRTAEIQLGPGKDHEIEIEFAPADRNMNIRIDHQTVLRHPLDFVMTAPAQVKFGLDETYAFKYRFDGRIRDAFQDIRNNALVR